MTPSASHVSASATVKIEYIFGLSPRNSAIGVPPHLPFIFPKHLFVGCTVEWVVLGLSAGVILISVACHVGVHVLSLDLQHKAVRVCVEELCAATILHLEVV